MPEFLRPLGNMELEVKDWDILGSIGVCLLDGEGAALLDFKRLGPLLTGVEELETIGFLLLLLLLASLAGSTFLLTTGLFVVGDGAAAVGVEFGLAGSFPNSPVLTGGVADLSFLEFPKGLKLGAMLAGELLLLAVAELVVAADFFVAKGLTPNSLATAGLAALDSVLLVGRLFFGAKGLAPKSAKPEVPLAFKFSIRRPLGLTSSLGASCLGASFSGSFCALVSLGFSSVFGVSTTFFGSSAFEATGEATGWSMVKISSTSSCFISLTTFGDWSRDL